MSAPAQPGPLEIFRQLLERAIAEPDLEKFHELLDDIAKLLGVQREEAQQIAAAASVLPAPAPSVGSQPSMEVDTFDIFCGLPDRNAVWMECCVGIERARERTAEIAAADPNEYFIFHAPSSAIVFRIRKADCLRINLNAKPKSAQGS